MQLETLEQLSEALCLVSWDQPMVPQLHQLHQQDPVGFCHVFSGAFLK